MQYQTDQQPGQHVPDSLGAAGAFDSTGSSGIDAPPLGKNTMSLASMILGIVSLVFVGWLVVPQIVGAFLGHAGLKKENPQGRHCAVTGLVLNYLSLLIYGAIWAFGIAMITIFRSSLDSAGDLYTPA